MRKSFELLDWMKEHFGGNGSTPGEPGQPGQPGILYRFTHGLKETGGVVKVDEGNGLAVNDHTGMLEVPIGEHLSYTSQGIDAKEGDTAQKGVVQLSDSITPESTHETAATPQAVKEYVDAKPTGGIDLSEDRAYNGSGTFQVATETDTQTAVSAISVGTVDKAHFGAIIVSSRHAQIGVVSEKVPTSLSVKPNSVTITPNNHTPGFKVTDKGATFDNFKVITEASLADEQNLGVVKLTHTVSHGEHPNEAVSPDGVAAYVDSKMNDVAFSSNVVSRVIEESSSKVKIRATGHRVGGVLVLCVNMKTLTELGGKTLVGTVKTNGVLVQDAPISSTASCFGLQYGEPAVGGTAKAQWLVMTAQASQSGNGSIDLTMNMTEPVNTNTVGNFTFILPLKQ